MMGGRSGKRVVIRRRMVTVGMSETGRKGARVSSPPKEKKQESEW